MSSSYTIRDLDRLYDHYYTAADAKVFFKSPGSPNTVLIDQCTAIAYDYNVSSVPIYTLGLSIPAFFSRGNGLGSGMLILPFTDELYLKAALKYCWAEEVTSEGAIAETPEEKVDIMRQAREKSDDEYTPGGFTQATRESSFEFNTINLVSVKSLFDIAIVLDNSTPYTNTEPKMIVLQGCKLTGESMELSTSRDGVAQQGYKFMFRSITRESVWQQ